VADFRRRTADTDFQAPCRIQRRIWPSADFRNCRPCNAYRLPLEESPVALPRLKGSRRGGNPRMLRPIDCAVRVASSFKIPSGTGQHSSSKRRATKLRQQTTHGIAAILVTRWRGEIDSNCRATSWTVSKSCKNVKPSPGVENGPAGSNSSRRSADFHVNLGHLDQSRQAVAAPSPGSHRPVSGCAWVSAWRNCSVTKRMERTSPESALLTS
jgi:hypothetical protein